MTARANTVRPVAIANRHPRLRFDRRAVARLIHALDAHHDALATPRSVLANVGELSIAFFSDAALARLHADFLDDPAPTDVITFEGHPVMGTAGEICVSADAAMRQVRAGEGRRASRQPVALDFSRELALYLVHGWLHLAGYDDLQPAKKRVMRRAEAKAMALLEREAALPVFRLQPRVGRA